MVWLYTKPQPAPVLVSRPTNITLYFAPSVSPGYSPSTPAGKPKGIIKKQPGNPTPKIPEPIPAPPTPIETPEETKTEPAPSTETAPPPIVEQIELGDLSGDNGGPGTGSPGTGNDSGQGGPTKQVDIKLLKRTKFVAPRYPPRALRAGIEGTVVIEATIGKDGKTKNIKVIRSSSFPILDQAAIEAIQKWEYTPTTIDGEPIELVLTVTVNFVLS